MDVRTDSWLLSDLVHVLAQLPDDVSLEARLASDEVRRLALLGRAYGLGNRLEIEETTGNRTSWCFRGVSSSAPGWATDGSLETKPPRTMAEMVEPLWPADRLRSPTTSSDDLLAGHRIAVVTNLPAHYRVPLLTGVERRLAAAGASLRVFFLGSSARGRPWLSKPEGLEFDHEFLTSVEVRLRRRRPPFLPLNLRSRLRAYDPTVLLTTGFSPLSSVEASIYASRRRIPLGIWSGEIASTAARRGRRLPRNAERRWLARRADFGIAYGSLAERYFRGLAPEVPVVIGRNTSVAHVQSAQRAAGASDVELVAVADLALPGKGLEVVLEALDSVGSLPYRLTVIGGSMPNGSLAKTDSESGRVRFLGSKPHEEVIATYRRSDVFVFPSRVDVFGLALVEAMASELAVVTSGAAGAAADLAVPGHNCLIADAGNALDWAERIRLLVGDQELRRSIAEGARETIRRRWTIEHAVDAMVSGLRLGVVAAEAKSR